MGGSPPGTVATTPDDAWRSALESVFLGAVRLARILAADLGGTDDGAAEAGSRTGTGGSIAFVLASPETMGVPPHPARAAPRHQGEPG